MTEGIGSVHDPEKTTVLLVTGGETPVCGRLAQRWPAQQSGCLVSSTKEAVDLLPCYVHAVWGEPALNLMAHPGVLSKPVEIEVEQPDAGLYCRNCRQSAGYHRHHQTGWQSCFQRGTDLITCHVPLEDGMSWHVAIGVKHGHADSRPTNGNVGHAR